MRAPYADGDDGATTAGYALLPSFLGAVTLAIAAGLAGRALAPLQSVDWTQFRDQVVRRGPE